MTTALLFALLTATCLIALFAPAYGAIAYYIFAVANPQGVWPWIFQDIRASLIVSVATILGVIFALAQNKLDLKVLNSVEVKILIALTVMVNLSHWFSPFQEQFVSRVSAADQVSIFNKIILFYLFSFVAIRSTTHWKMLVYVFAGTALYYTYWANSAYLNNYYWLFSRDGRLTGPGSLYADENGFALIFIVGFPVVFYSALLAKRIWVKCLLLSTIPLILHAVLLTSSRGALLSTAIVGLYIAFSTKSKALGLLIICLGVLFVIDQGGTVLNRVDYTVQRTNTDYGDDKPVDLRLLAWTAGLQMIKDYPVLGVGAGKFVIAAPQYLNGRRIVAHNTFLQFASNSGFLAGILYLGFFFSAYKNFKNEQKYAIDSTIGDDRYKTTTRKMLIASMIGFFTASVFLDLMLYEIFYLLLLVYAVRRQLIKTDNFTVGDPVPKTL